MESITLKSPSPPLARTPPLRPRSPHARMPHGPRAYSRALFTPELRGGRVFPASPLALTRVDGRVYGYGKRHPSHRFHTGRVRRCSPETSRRSGVSELRELLRQ